MRRIKFGVTVLKMSILVSYKQERVFASRELKNQESSKEFASNYNEAKNFFGTRFVEVSFDANPSDIYFVLCERWSIECVFRKDKTDLDFNRTRVHDEFSVIGQCFINNIATSLYLKDAKN